MKSNVKLVLINGEKFFGPGIAALLRKIDEKGSIQSACTEMNMSYSKAWKIIKRADAVLGFPLLDSHNGGKGGGKTALTERGRRFLCCYEDMQQKLYHEADRLTELCFQEFTEMKTDAEQ